MTVWEKEGRGKTARQRKLGAIVKTDYVGPRGKKGAVSRLLGEKGPRWNEFFRDCGGGKQRTVHKKKMTKEGEGELGVDRLEINLTSRKRKSVENYRPDA